VAESQQRKFNSQHLADRRFHCLFAPGEILDDASPTGRAVPSAVTHHDLRSTAQNIVPYLSLALSMQE
jgi:hypothetical protein